MIAIDSIEILNLVPKFLKYYEKANSDSVDNDARWSLWKEHYNFAAIPPGEEGQKIARLLLEEAWEKYQENLEFIKQWEPNQQRVEEYLNKVKTLLDCDKSISFVVIYFVGAFEENPFVAPYDHERLALCLPIENGNSDILLAHELTHIVHSQTANLSANWERTIASTILQEGLAAHVSKYLVPGEPDERYIEFSENWLKSCEDMKTEILKGIYPYLESSASEVVFKFTIGNGTTNHEREAYFVGWEIVKKLLEEGMSFNELAMINEVNILDYIRNILKDI
jgi:hypothetical protein